MIGGALGVPLGVMALQRFDTVWFRHVFGACMIAYGGYMYMGSADMWGNKQQAKEIIGEAIIGLLLLFAMYLILYQINPNLLNLDVLKSMSSTNSQSTANGGSELVGNSGPSQFNATGGLPEGSKCSSGNYIYGVIQNGVCVIPSQVQPVGTPCDGGAGTTLQDGSCLTNSVPSI